MDYLPEIIKLRGNGALSAQCVPLDQDLHKLSNYRQFLAARRRLLSETVNRFIQASVESEGGK